MNIFKLRWQIFNYEVRFALKQIQHTSLLVIMFLGVALPALVFFLLLGIGSFLNAQNSSAESYSMALVLLVLQSVILTLFRPAILALRFRKYVQALTRYKLKLFVSDALLGLLCCPFLLLLMFVLASSDLSQLSRAMPGFLLASLMVLFAFISMLSVKQTLSALIALSAWAWISLTLLDVSVSLWLLMCHLITLFCAVCMAVYPKNGMHFSKPSTMNLAKVWWRFVLSHSQHLQLFLLAMMLILIGGYYCAINLEDFKHPIALLCFQLMALLSANMQLLVVRQLLEHQKFYALIMQSRLDILSQYCVVSMVSLICIGAHALVFGASTLAFGYILTVLLCILSLMYSKKYLVLTWAAASVLVYFL
ncbi:DUF6136 family protein [Ningiella sp. W23]|uniref:DUF6136 family protein n=1 Tax=Ningiella sp. W23 TaxID=3023715 RepID=UPI0037567AE2